MSVKFNITPDPGAYNINDMQTYKDIFFISQLVFKYDTNQRVIQLCNMVAWARANTA